VSALEWICSRDASDSLSIDAAAVQTRVVVVAWLVSLGWAWSDEKTASCTAAAAKGHLPLLQPLLMHGCPWDRYTNYAAAAAGHLHVLQWMMLQADVPACDEYACFSAARGGHIHVLEWLTDVCRDRDSRRKMQV
jgi:hypothetical protein